MEAKQKYEACLDALKAYAADAGFADVLIGLSGGIDSAVTAVMCVDAFGADHVHGYMLPGPYSTGHSVDDARELADNLHVEATVLSILEPYEAFERTIERTIGEPMNDLAVQNTQARCRMVCLMALSNHYGWMLVNTGNKSEAMMGYSTLYGDTAGAFAPLGGLYKTDVYAVGRYRNDQAAAAGQVPPIPANTFTKPPSAELAPGQQDEKALGIDYAALDRILIGHYELGKSADELADTEHDAEAIGKLLRRADGYAFKRAQEPPFPQTRFY